MAAADLAKARRRSRLNLVETEVIVAPGVAPIMEERKSHDSMLGTEIRLTTSFADVLERAPLAPVLSITS